MTRSSKVTPTANTSEIRIKRDQLLRCHTGPSIRGNLRSFLLCESMRSFFHSSVSAFHPRCLGRPRFSRELSIRGMSPPDRAPADENQGDHQHHERNHLRFL